MVDGEQRRDRVEHPRRVEGRDKRQEMPVGIREPGNSPGGVDRPMLTHGEDGSARSDRDDDIAGAGTDQPKVGLGGWVVGLKNLGPLGPQGLPTLTYPRY